MTRWSGHAYADDRRGVAALEFVLAAPLIMLFMVGVFDISHAVTLEQEVYNASHTIVTSASSLAVQPDNSSSLTVDQVQQALSAIFAAMPTLRNGEDGGVRSATLTSVFFQQVDPTCVASATVTCIFVPYAKWSVSYVDPPGRFAGNINLFQSVSRCPGSHAPLSQVTPTQYVSGDMTTLPTLNVTQPIATLVADVHYRYTPLFLGYFMPTPVDFWASSLWPVRSINKSQTVANNYTHYDLANTAKGVGQCP